MGAFKPWHWIVLIVVVVLVFGAGRLPDIAKSLGQSMKVFKKEVKELREDDDQPPAQIQQPQEGTYYTQPTQQGQAAPSSQEGTSQH
ncbi:Sec-independent protein translocase subunit TatA [Actinomyces bowdenii]|uniref:Sec-independent protein translocase protein TatA n=1 Tax=Actinomyces bowdenii TaxID=131109 RepID=A0A853EKI9_9ACTO|nr:Sec-independent protein translocase subunit TatA [Actinomyces bowdenii]MBF0696193.1 Sec-independent protein translocase subunit TatA [Actinomyces bowdenii]MCR2052507.1 Sec-independent protein translocase subunit TatA [Actinomyces bowdenii]NYS68366.1 Sec-independent protein translocase subunit TatA [Actinomyces bowdenii]